MTMLEEYNAKLKNVRAKIGEGKGTPMDAFAYQEIKYRIGNLETFNAIGRTDEEGKKKRETAKNTLIAVFNSGTNKSRSLVLDTDQVYKAYISEFVNAFIPVWIQYRDTLFKI